MRVVRFSILTGEPRTREIPVDPGAFRAWDGAPVETRPPVSVAFPDLSEDDWLFVLAGLLPGEKLPTKE